jgi:hypothetical protein
MEKNELPATTEAIRNIVLRRATTINQRLLERFTEIEDHLGSGSHLAVLGALNGAETAIENMRNLMFLLGDCFPPLE